MGVRNEDDWIGQDRAYLRYRCKRGAGIIWTLQADLHFVFCEVRPSKIGLFQKGIIRRPNCHEKLFRIWQEQRHGKCSACKLEVVERSAQLSSSYSRENVRVRRTCQIDLSQRRYATQYATRHC